MSLRVVQITDLHLTANPESKLYGVDTTKSLEKVIGAIKGLPKQPDVIVATGDIAEDGSEASYRRLQDLFAGMTIPTYVLPGNHDNATEMRRCFGCAPFYYTSSARIQDWGFVFLDSQVESQSHGRVDLVELESQLRELDGCPVLIALHHTPTCVCPSNGCKLTNATEFTALLKNYANVIGVIAGHTHTVSEVDAGGHVQFTTPSTFAQAIHAQLGEPVDHDDFWASHRLDGTKQGFRILDLSSQGEIKSQVRWVDCAE